MVAIDGFERFGKIGVFALDLKLLDDPDDGRHAPFESIGSWGALRLWVSGQNLTEMEIAGPSGTTHVTEIRWYLAPFFRWLAANWNPLLHEMRLPVFLGAIERRPRWARSAYLSVLRAFGDTERFVPWQAWATRHSLRHCAEGGIFPDVFFQRMGDQIEISWGDRIEPGAEGTTFIIEDGAGRAPVDEVAGALDAALSWFLEQPAVTKTSWRVELASTADQRIGDAQAKARLSWFIDASAEPGHLTGLVEQALSGLQAQLSEWSEKAWLAHLAPEIAMFGALSPRISDEAASRLLAAILGAKTDHPEPRSLADHVDEIPAWSSVAPWDEGYGLAREVLDELDPTPNSGKTEVELIINRLEISSTHERLDVNGPRGVAIAGAGYRPTILVNDEHPMNAERGGVRFTLAHELCHILFDREKARSFVHASTPWAEPAVEQRANAFAAMLLMPLDRIDLDQSPKDIEALRLKVNKLTKQLEVGRTALIHHLANLDEISASARELLLARH